MAHGGEGGSYRGRGSARQTESSVAKLAEKISQCFVLSSRSQDDIVSYLMHLRLLVLKVSGLALRLVQEELASVRESCRIVMIWKSLLLEFMPRK